MTDEQRATYISGLLQERAGYEQHGRDDKVAEVNAELQRLGEKGSAPAKRAEKRPASKKSTR